MNRRDVLVKFVVDEFLQGQSEGTNPPADIPDDLDLIGSGVIDSLGLLKVVAFLEERFGVAIAPEAMVPDTFKSIASMMSLVAEQLDAA